MAHHASPSAHLFRSDLLAGVVIAVARGGGEWASPAADACARLGAVVADLAGADEEALGAVAARLVSDHGHVDALICDAGSAFAGGLDAMRSCVDESWNATRAVANAAFIGEGRGGKVVLIAPRANAGPQAGAARAALANIARTLSIEWARYAITTTAIAPGVATSPADVATLVAFIASSAGDYYSGCTFTLGRLARPLS